MSFYLAPDTCWDKWVSEQGSSMCFLSCQVWQQETGVWLIRGSTQVSMWRVNICNTNTYIGIDWTRHGERGGERRVGVAWEGEGMRERKGRLKSTHSRHEHQTTTLVERKVEKR